MPAKLRITPLADDPFELTIGNTATIGRTADNTVCLSGSPLVSRQHALIRCHDGYQYQIIDLGSRNGTLVNGQRVVMPMTLDPGARIEIAKNELVFERIEDDFANAHLEVTLAGSMAGIASAIRPVALLVCDIRGFSSMAEKISSSHLAQQLGVWFREAGNLVTKSGGTVDKFIGDAVLAYWSGCGTDEVDCAATLQIARDILGLAAKSKWANSEPFNVGIALHFGSVTCGNVGIDAQRDATIIGDVVNTVFRLESVMKELSQQVLLSADFAERLPASEKLVDLGERKLKGKQQAVRIYGLG
ncbi:MAG TPA: adenylate/guanylate cyclase domain-containing protein [Chthoniobacterales bacterium]|jgi:adenylate cyclase|nr:adenylate/guanylate cyclase domain-containing protein [Chthoniobacterales bacterium]